MDIIFDIDGTLADATHRRHHLDKTPRDWDSFFAEQVEDTAIAPVATVFNALKNMGRTHSIIFMTARPANYRRQTVDWLRAKSFWGRDTALYMRKENDRRDDDIVKRELLQECRADGYNPKMAFEDRLRVCRVWEEEGIFVFCVNQGRVEF